MQLRTYNLKEGANGQADAKYGLSEQVTNRLYDFTMYDENFNQINGFIFDQGEITRLIEDEAGDDITAKILLMVER
jgi:deoxyhypusine synthase